jgi:hypothetical protein
MARELIVESQPQRDRLLFDLVELLDGGLTVEQALEAGPPTFRSGCPRSPRRSPRARARRGGGARRRSATGAGADELRLHALPVLAVLHATTISPHGRRIVRTFTSLKSAAASNMSASV